jgi:ribonuclease HI
LYKQLPAFLTEVNRKEVLYLLKNGDSSGAQMGPRQNEGARGGLRQKLSFSLGQYTTVFQAQVHAIKAYAVENIKRVYLKRNIYIICNSQAVIKTLDNCKINSKLVWYCCQSLLRLAECNNVQLLCMPGHKGIEGNEIADQLAKRARCIHL